MKKGICIFALAVASVLVFTAAASAFEICFGLSNFGNKFRLEFTQHGQFWNITGNDCVFGPYPASGALTTEQGALTMGFTLHAVDDLGSDIHIKVPISPSTLSGRYYGWRDRFGDVITGTMSVISCGQCSFSEGAGPDVTAE